MITHFCPGSRRPQSAHRWSHAAALVVSDDDAAHTYTDSLIFQAFQEKEPGGSDHLEVEPDSFDGVALLAVVVFAHGGQGHPPSAIALVEHP